MLSKTRNLIKRPALASIILIVILSSLFIYYYAGAQSEISAKDRQIANMNKTISSMSNTISSMNSTISQQNSSITSLRSTENSFKAQILSLNSEIQGLNSEIATLGFQLNNAQSSLNASNAKIKGLDAQVSALENSSALLQFELSAVETVGKSSVNLFAVNQTMTFMPNSTSLFLTTINNYNGTIVLEWPTPCPEVGAGDSWVNGQYQLYFLFNERGLNGTGAYYAPVNSSGYSIYFQNIGNLPVTCTISLIDVYNV